MASEQEIKEKFWKQLKSDMTVMLGLDIEGQHAQPMTAQLEHDEHGPIYFFTSKDTDLVRQLGQSHAAMLHFASKGHDLFACVAGDLSPHNDRATIDRLWNPFVAAWFEGGKTDPKLQLLRFDPNDAQIWLNESSIFSGIKLMLGRDPKKEYADKTADVRLS
jgi:general stress protein 26